MLAFALSVAVACLLTIGVWQTERRYLENRDTFRPVVTVLLIAAASLTLAIIHLSLWLRTPGAYGPVQYWSGDEAGFFIFRVRTLALFLLLVEMFLAVLVGGTILVELCAPSRRRQGALFFPVVSLLVFGWAYLEFVDHQFFPTV